MFANVNNHGLAALNTASNVNGVRPDFDLVDKSQLSAPQAEKGEIVLPYMVNTKHDTSSYESRGYQREIFDGNALYDAYLRAKKGSDWKSQVQNFEMNWLVELSKIQQSLENMTYELLQSNDFTMYERGNIRRITGEQIHDRVVKHALCDEILSPSIERFLIYDNGASIRGKGINFTRRRLLVHLHKFYMEHGSNDGYILLIDFSKYYDNIRHDVLMELFKRYVTNEHALWLLRKVIDKSKVDVSYMTDEEYENCLNALFNSLLYQHVDQSLLTGEKFMRKHLNIGDQVAQIAGISYPMPLDNYIKIVKGIKYYGRYMDDSYVIHKDKGFLQKLLMEIIEKAREIGITVNARKTRICKLSQTWRFLQIRYSLSKTGRIIQKINPKRLTVMRRKMKKLAYRLSAEDFSNWYHSWFRNYYKIMSKRQRDNIEILFNELKEATARCNTQ